MEYAKVFWLGRHTTSPQLGAPVSKVHQAGLQLLRSLGWEQVCCSSNNLLICNSNDISLASSSLV